MQIKGTLDKLVQQYKATEDEFLAFQKKHNIQVGARFMSRIGSGLRASARGPQGGGELQTVG
jgi:hypothetical protein